MHSALEPVCVALEELAQSIVAAQSNDQNLMEILGWQFPPLNRHDLAQYPSTLAVRLRKADPTAVDAELEPILLSIPPRILKIRQQFVPRLFNGEQPQIIGSYLATMEWLRTTLSPLLDWQVIEDPLAAPPKMARRIRALDSRLKELEPNMDELAQQIQTIREGYAAADALPADLQTLKESQEKVTNILESVGESGHEIASRRTSAEKDKVAMDLLLQEAQQIVTSCSEAYRTTTSTGLAAAFTERATSLGYTMFAWIVGLIGALAVGAYLGAQRILILSSVLGSAQRDWGAIFLEVLLSLLSVGAPLWFAWLSTKQIGQRFRLMEDYAYKASISRAYEGYRREAARIDSGQAVPEFEARLFSTTLTRLEEPPLRLVENASHGSPYQELLNSDLIKRAMDLGPEAKTQIVDFAKEVLNKAKGRSSAGKILAETAEVPKT